MAHSIVGFRPLVALLLVSVFVFAACAPAPAPAAQPAKPAAEPAKPAAQPAKPAAQPAKPAAEPAKPAAEPAKPAAQPAKPAAQPAKPAAQPVELRAGCSYIKGDVLCDPVEKFAELVKEKSKGGLIIQVYYQSLGVEQQLTQSVMTGSVDIGMISNGNAGRFTNAFFVYDLPFLFKSQEAMERSLKGPIATKLMAQFEQDLGIKVIMAESPGSGRDIQTRAKPLKTPADIRGLKIRVVSTPIDLATFKGWGANPTPIDWAQTYAALQQGVVDGVGVTSPFLLTSKTYEVVKHNLLIDYQYLFEAFFINAKKFASLSPDHQKILVDAGQEAEVWHRKAAAELAQRAVRELTAKGVTTYKPTPEEYAQWAGIREKVWQEVAEQQKGKIDMDQAKQLYATQ